MMKVSLAIIFILVASVSFAGPDYLILKKNLIIPGRTDIYNDNGKRQGTMRENPIIKGRTDIYDKNGAWKGYTIPSVNPGEQIVIKVKPK